jgi:hypothetical protein
VLTESPPSTSTTPGTTLHGVEPPMFVTLNRGQLPPPRGPQPEQGVRLRRAEEIETLSYRTVVVLNQESRLAPRWRIATIARRAERAQRLAGDRTGRADRRQAERATRTGRSSRAHHQSGRRGCSPMPASPPLTVIGGGVWHKAHPYQGSAHRLVFPGWHLRPGRTMNCWRPLETVTNRSAPMACGPDMDQAHPARGGSGAPHRGPCLAGDPRPAAPDKRAPPGRSPC